MNVLGIAYDWDPAAALIVDGRIVAFGEEDRFTRIKHSPSRFPTESIGFCLRHAGLTLDDVDYVTVGWDLPSAHARLTENFASSDVLFPDKGMQSKKWEKDQLEWFDESRFTEKVTSGFKICFPNYKKKLPIRYCGHHLAHACSAYFCSGFNEAAVITMDGHGDEKVTVVWKGENNRLEKVHEINMPHSLGWFYAIMTRFCGFIPNEEEGKTMGLAPFGKSDQAMQAVFDRMYSLTDNGYLLDPTMLLYGARTLDPNFPDTLIKALGKPRQANDEITPRICSVARYAQETLEKIVCHLAERTLRDLHLDTLCLAGGVALNCRMNQKLRELLCVKHLFVQPVSNDAGTTFGSAIALYAEKALDLSGFKMDTLYFGPASDQEHVKSACSRFDVKFQTPRHYEREVARRLAEGKIVGWFHGRMETGKRSLGNRSILADPRREESKSLVNSRYKSRESWRPFCPSIIDEKKNDFFKTADHHEYMIQSFDVIEKQQAAIPAVVHVDGTARIQTVTQKRNATYWNLLNEFDKMTAVPILLNTSFNVKGEPVVCTPEDAIRDFLRTDLDVLAIEGCLIERNGKHGFRFSDCLKRLLRWLVCRKSIRSSRLLTRILFGWSPRPKNCITLWDCTTLVLRKALKRWVKDGTTVLEMGTGDVGMLSIMLSKIKMVSSSAADILKPFLENAACNALNQKSNITFYHSDLFKNINGCFDVIFFNPPYIPEGRINLDQQISFHNFPSPEFAPQTLLGGKDGLDVIRKFLGGAGSHLNPGGCVVLGVNLFYVDPKSLDKVIRESHMSIIGRVTSRLTECTAFQLALDKKPAAL